MKRTLLSLLSALAAAVLLQGCAGVGVCRQGTDMVAVENSGGFLFYCIPIYSGDPDYPNRQVCNWFSNTVHVDTNIRLLEEAARKEGAAGIRNVVTHFDDERVLFLLFKVKSCKTSAELVRY